ncbi:Holliday junction resolvase RuvX [Elstera sp.]|jgi:putative Holliday junction resolvase|uniref:Holliday junction resolvase RuvX n=1 Tax=Elstera sp. TaxID=1916664 RepID=UPI0037C0E0CB
MALVDLSELAPVLATRRYRLLGLDLGTKTIGLAISDGLGLSATPVETIRRTKFTADAEALLKLCKARDVGGLVLGLPVNMDGSEGPRAQSTRTFIDNLSEKTALPMALWDERLSTVAVTRLMLEADLSRARRAEIVDKMAAAYILQGALDRLRALAGRALEL